MINKIKLLTATAVLSLFSACGGGGGGGSAIVDNSEYKKSVGDAFTYFYTDTSNANVQTSYFFTRNYTPVSSDQSYVNDQTYSNKIVKSKNKFDSDHQEINYTSGSPTTTTCVNNPTKTFTGLMKNLKVGSTWDLNYTRTCTGASPSVATWTNKGSVTASEPYTILGITFDAFKLVYISTETTSTNYRVTNTTVWRDKYFDVRLYSDFATSNYANSSNLTTPINSSVYSERLYAFNVAGFGNNKPDVSRYAGRWDLSGSDNSSLSSIAITVDGIVTGIGTKGEVGTIDKNGTLNFSTANGTTFTGSLTSGVAGTGTWKNATTSSSWTALHL